uniref:Uncharacterized protein n=1 Tax=Anopheles minimus TaxID=112268 RepID=A0A182WQ59_9DIPT
MDFIRLLPTDVTRSGSLTTYAAERPFIVSTERTSMFTDHRFHRYDVTTTEAALSLSVMSGQNIDMWLAGDIENHPINRAGINESGISMYQRLKSYYS